MYRLIALCFIGVAFARQPDAPQHSADHLPDTEFSCRDKVLGGYYADPDAQCQMFHVCVKVAGVGIQDFRFLCPNGTAFDQEAQICAGWADVACEPAALYYSSDNFDLYRIGSGFESKKAPTNFEDEPDFHLQRAEPDILSGAHSSNFFNNREGKDNQDASESGGKGKNQIEPQRKKVVKKLQRRPTESTTRLQPSPTTPRQFTNNFAGSYNPTSSRPAITSTARPKTQYNENYNNYNQRSGNNYQSNRQPSSTTTTAAPVSVSDYYKSTQDYSQKSEQQTTAQNKFNRNFRSRQPSTPEYNYNNENEQSKNKQTTAVNVNYNKESRKFDNTNYDQSNNYNNQQSTPKYNFIKERKQSYEAQQSTTSVNYNSETSAQYNKQTSPQYNQQYTDNNQYTTPKNEQKYNNNNNQQQPIKYNAKITQQSTPQYNQYNNQQSSSTQYNNNNQQSSTQYNNNNQQSSSPQYNYDNQEFDKIKSTTKHAEKKQQYSAQKQSTQINYNEKQYNNQQTPTPKYNTNLQYDNNQQSTPFYNANVDYNKQTKNNQPSTPAYEQYSSASPSNFRGSNYKSTNDYQQYSTAQQFSSSTNNYNQYDQSKSTPNYQQYSTGRPSTSETANFKAQQKATPAPFKSNKPEDYDDGQYRPELYEREAGGEYDVTARHNTRNESPIPKAPEQELLKAAHSINIAASGNQFSRDNNKPQVSSTSAPVTQPPRVTAARVVYTTQPPKSVYSSLAVVTSAAPRPFSARPSPTSTLAPTQRPIPVKQAPIVQDKSSHSSASKSKPNSKSKDVSYDYAYYDNSDHYHEYENIEEFGKTSKKQ